jgi:hypothetical protein
MKRTLVDLNERLFIDDRHAGFSLAGLSLALAMYFGPMAGVIGLLVAGVLGESPLLAEAAASSAMGPTPVPHERND